VLSCWIRRCQFLLGKCSDMKRLGSKCARRALVLDYMLVTIVTIVISWGSKLVHKWQY
jgi:hypothetical protein